MKTIIEMAREADGILLSDSEIFGLGFEFEMYQLERFAELVRAEAQAEEREACAAQLDFNAQAASNGGDEYIAALLWQEAEEIRSRGNT